MSELRNLDGRIAKIEIAIAAAATGDFDVRLELNEDDEMSSVESSINVMLESLKDMFEENRRKNAALERSLATIIEQREAIRELSIPMIEVWDDVLVLPIIGRVDSARCVDIMSGLLHAIAAARTKFVILDLTGVADVAAEAAGGLIQVAQAARMLGARCIVTGLHPAVARMLVDLDVHLGDLRVRSNLKAGLRDAIEELRRYAPRAR